MVATSKVGATVQKQLQAAVTNPESVRRYKAVLDKRSKLAFGLVLGVSIFALFIGALLAFFMTLSITQPLRRAVEAARAGESMQQTVQSIKRVVDIMAEISAASQEQSIGIDQVNLAVGQMDQVTQENTALVEEAATASTSMQDQASQLAVLWQTA